MQVISKAAIIGATILAGLGLSACQSPPPPPAPPVAGGAPIGSQSYDPYTGGQYAPDVQGTRGGGPSQVISASRANPTPSRQQPPPPPPPWQAAPPPLGFDPNFPGYVPPPGYVPMQP
jgi:hypothetical protein